MASRLFASTATDVPFWPNPFCAVNNSITKCTFLGITVSCMEPITWDTEFSSGTEGGHVCKFDNARKTSTRRMAAAARQIH